MKSFTNKLKSISWPVISLIAAISPYSVIAAERVNPDTDLVYLGAFRMPSSLGYDARGFGLTFYPNGDGGRGSLFISQGQAASVGFGTAEISIPQPINSKNADNLNRATLLQGERQIANISPPLDQFGDILYMPKQGNQKTDKLYWSAYYYYNTEYADYNSIGWAELNLASPNSQGPFHVGAGVSHINKTGKYLFEADHLWSDTYTGGKYILTGRHREAGGANGSKGPTLYAIAPWTQDNPPVAGASFPDVTLLEYPSGASGLPTNFPDYASMDLWRDAVWIKSGDKHAVLIVGMKGTGSCYGEGSACNDPCDSSKGYHSYPYAPKFIWYAVDDLAAVAQGQKKPDGPIPYSTWTPTANTWNTGSCSSGYGGVAYDTTTQKLYVIELMVDLDLAPIVHVFQVKSGSEAIIVAPTTLVAPTSLSIVK